MYPLPSASSQHQRQVGDDSHRPSAYKWNHFEVRTLVCLIIKGEHLDPDDPMHITDKLNMALNPSSWRNNSNYDRDIPHEEVQHMLKRILSKKMHAVDVSERDCGATVTRAKVNAFMRSLDFDGSMEEWVTSRKDVMRVEGEKRHGRYMARKEETTTSPRSSDDRAKRKRMVRSPRAARLLCGWGIGASFWEGDTQDTDRSRTRGKSRDSPSSGAAAFTPSSNGGLSYITDGSSAPSAGKEPPVHAFRLGNANSAAMPPVPAVATWSGGFTPLSSSIMPAQMTPASRYGYGGPGGFHSGPQQQQQQQQQQSTGWNGGEIWGNLPNAGSDRQRPPAGSM